MAIFHGRYRRGLCCLAGLATMAIFASGQQEQKLPTFKADVKVVNVLATVRDKHGKLVSDLSQNDFTLEEDGRPQNIRYFSRETDLPLTLGLLVDTSRSQRLSIEQERSASATFADRTLRENKDTAFLIQFDREVVLLQDLTQSPQKLNTALDKLQLASADTGQRQGGGNKRQSPGDDSGNPNDAGGPGGDDSGSQGGRGGYPGGQGGQRRAGGQQHQRQAGTLLYDSVFLSAEDVMQKQQGRKAVILLSDGVDRGSKKSLDSAIRSAQQADMMVYSVYFAGEEGGDRGGPGQGQGRGGGPWGGPGGRRGGIGFPGGGPMGGGGGYPGGPGGGGGRGGGRGPQSNGPKVDGKKILERISKETGGRMFEASKKQPIDKIYQQIEDELRHQYSFGYTPDRKAEDGPEYRKIHLTTTKKDLTVEARDGYYVSKPLETKAAKQQP